MTENSDDIKVSITIGDTTVEFTGSPESVMPSLNGFLMKQIPTFNLAKRITVNYSAKELIEKFEDYVKITPEGPRVWKEDKKMSDREVISLQLLAARIASEFGNGQPPELSLGQIQSATGINPKSISSRLSEILKLGYVEKINAEHGVWYRLTTQGIHWLGKALMKKGRG